MGALRPITGRLRPAPKTGAARTAAPVMSGHGGNAFDSLGGRTMAGRGLMAPDTNDGRKRQLGK